VVKESLQLVKNNLKNFIQIKQLEDFKALVIPEMKDNSAKINNYY
jgi:hypothetical protein